MLKEIKKKKKTVFFFFFFLKTVDRGKRHKYSIRIVLCNDWYQAGKSLVPLQGNRLSKAALDSALQFRARTFSELS